MHSFEYLPSFKEDYAQLDNSVQKIIDKRVDKIKAQPQLGKPLGKDMFVEKFDGWRITYFIMNDVIVFSRIRRRDVVYKRGWG